MNELCHQSTAGLARETSLLDTEAHVLSVLAGPPHGLLAQDSGPGTCHVEYEIAQ